MGVSCFLEEYLFLIRIDLSLRHNPDAGPILAQHEHSAIGGHVVDNLKYVYRQIILGNYPIVWLVAVWMLHSCMGIIACSTRAYSGSTWGVLNLAGAGNLLSNRVMPHSCGGPSVVLGTGRSDTEVQTNIAERRRLGYSGLILIIDR